MAEKVLFDDANEEDQIGIVRGLACTSVGGDTLQIEVNVMPGKGEPSDDRPARRCDEGISQTALTWVRSVAFREICSSGRLF